jgi:hypothetical protein
MTHRKIDGTTAMLMAWLPVVAKPAEKPMMRAYEMSIPIMETRKSGRRPRRSTCNAAPNARMRFQIARTVHISLYAPHNALFDLVLTERRREKRYLDWRGYPDRVEYRGQIAAGQKVNTTVMTSASGQTY